VKRIALLLCLVLLMTCLVGCGAREIDYTELTERASLTAQLTRHSNFSCVYSTGQSRGNVFVDKDICIIDMSDTLMAYLPDGRGYLAQKTGDETYSVLPIVNLVHPSLADKTAYEMFAAVYPSESETIRGQSITDGQLTVEAYDTLGLTLTYVLDAGTLDLISISGVRDGEENAQEWTGYKYDVDVPESKAQLLSAFAAWESLFDEDSWVLTIVTINDRGEKTEKNVKLQNNAIAYVALGQNCGYSGLYADENGETSIDIYSELDKVSDATVYAVYGN